MREETIDAFTLKPTRESRIFQNDTKVEHKNAVRVSFVPIPDEDQGYPVETSCNNKTYWNTTACGIMSCASEELSVKY